MVYSGSRHGFTYKAFEDKVANIQETVIVVKSTAGTVFGGYTNIPWKWPSTGVDIEKDHSSFVFELYSND